MVDDVMPAVCNLHEGRKLLLGMGGRFSEEHNVLKLCVYVCMYTCILYGSILHPYYIPPNDPEHG